MPIVNVALGKELTPICRLVISMVQPRDVATALLGGAIVTFLLGVVELVVPLPPPIMIGTAVLCFFLGMAIAWAGFQNFD